MARKYLSPSLDRLFNEIDARWPNRDRRTDGWYTNTRESVGHNRGARGLVHAIDVDDDGIDENYILSHIYKGGNVLRYIIWNRGIYHRRDGWARKPYYGDSPHTDHMHIEIDQTTTAEQYKGHWGIAPGNSGLGSVDDNSGQGIVGAFFDQFYKTVVNEQARDYRPQLYDMGQWFTHGSQQTSGAAAAMRGMRK